MKTSSVLIMLVTATSIVWGANLTAGAGTGASLRSRVSSRAGAGKRAAGPGTCPTSGFSPPGLSDCVCNFAGACDPNTGAQTQAAQNDPTNLNGIAPHGMNNFALGTASVGTICEGGTVAILYDCNALIPLYAATVIEGDNAGSNSRRKDCWRRTTDMRLSKDKNAKNLLAGDKDYQNSKYRYYCYEDPSGKLFQWNGQPCPNPEKLSIHKGHMVAALYGHGHGKQAGQDATFTYTNVIPQVAGFNSGKWRVAELSVMNKAKLCQKSAEKNGNDAKVYVVVGVIPSSFLGKPRFFGSAGFGNFQGMSKINPLEKFRVSFPEIMWTAGCCIHTDGTVGDKFAFWRRNWPDKTDPVKHQTSAAKMFADIQTAITTAWPGVAFNPPNVFPNKPNCN